MYSICIVGAILISFSKCNLLCFSVLNLLKFKGGRTEGRTNECNKTGMFRTQFSRTIYVLKLFANFVEEQSLHSLTFRGPSYSYVALFSRSPAHSQFILSASIVRLLAIELYRNNNTIYQIFFNWLNYSDEMLHILSVVQTITGLYQLQ